MNPLTGQPAGQPYFADISEWHSSLLADDRQQAGGRKLQVLRNDDGEPQARYSARIEVDSRGVSDTRTVARCWP